MQDKVVAGIARHSSESALAVASLAAAFVHAVGEGFYHLRWGQPFSALLPDIVAIGMMGIAGWKSLSVRPGSAVALLAASWAFLICLACRALFERMATNGLAGPSDGEPPIVLDILAVLLLLTLGGFSWAMRLAWRASSRPEIQA